MCGSTQGSGVLFLYMMNMVLMHSVREIEHVFWLLVGSDRLGNSRRWFVLRVLVDWCELLGWVVLRE